MRRIGSLILPAIVVAAIVAGQLTLHALDKEFCLTQLTMSVYYAIVVIGLCLVMGYAGQVSLGHGGFFAIGGYTTAILTTHDYTAFKDAGWARLLKGAHAMVVNDDLFGNQVLNVAPWAAFLAAMAVTFVVACLIGYPALRLKGHYLAMATLGFGLIVNKILLSSSLAGAADGITGVPEWKLAGGLAISGSSGLRVQNYYMACGVALVMLILLRNLVRSRAGRAMFAIHDSETAAGTLGINTSAYKLKVFVLSAMMAATAGLLLTHYSGGIGPSEAGAIKSVRYVALAAAGGMANLWGGAIVSTLVNFFSLRGWFGSYDNAVFGGLLIVIISVAPDGPLEPIGKWLRGALRKLRHTPRDEHGAA